MNETLLTVAETARRLNVSKPTVYRRISDGSLPAVRIGDAVGPLRVVEHELEQWLFRTESSREATAAEYREAGDSFPPGKVTPPPAPARSATGFPAGPVATGPDERAREDGLGRASGRKERQ